MADFNTLYNEIQARLKMANDYIETDKKVMQ